MLLFHSDDYGATLSITFSEGIKVVMRKWRLVITLNRNTSA